MNILFEGNLTNEGPHSPKEPFCHHHLTYCCDISLETNQCFLSSKCDVSNNGLFEGLLTGSLSTCGGPLVVTVLREHFRASLVIIGSAFALWALIHTLKAMAMHCPPRVSGFSCYFCSLSHHFGAC